MTSSEHTSFDRNWLHLPAPPRVPLPSPHRLLQLAGAQLIRWAHWYFLPLVVVAAGFYVAAGVYAAPHISRLTHFGAFLALLAGCGGAAAVIAARRQWIRRHTLSSLYGHDANFIEWLQHRMTKIACDLKAHACEGTSSPERATPNKAFDYAADVVHHQPYLQLEKDLTHVDNDLASAWSRVPELREYLQRVREARNNVRTLADAAALLKQNSQTPRNHLTDKLRELADRYSPADSFGAYLKGLVEAGEQRLPTQLQIRESDRRPLTPEELQLAREAAANQREMIELGKAQLVRERQAREDAAFRDASAKLRITLTKWDNNFRGEAATLRDLHQTIQNLPSPAFAGMAEDAAAWRGTVAQLRTTLDSLSRDADNATTKEDVDALEAELTGLENVRDRHAVGMLQLEGFEADQRPLRFPSFHGGKARAILAFLKHVNEAAATEAKVRKLWRIIDTNGDVCLFYYGPRGPRSPKWQSIFCRVSFTVTGRESLFLAARIAIPFGIDDDPCPYDYQQDSLMHGDRAKIHLSFQVMKKQVERTTRSEGSYRDKSQREAHKELRADSTSDEQTEASEQSSRQHNSDIVNEKSVSRQPHSEKSHERSRGSEAASELQSKQTQEERHESLVQDEQTVEAATGVKSSHSEEVGWESERVTTLTSSYLVWDPEKLLRPWKSFQHNIEAAQMFDTIAALIDSAGDALQKASADAYEERLKSSDSSLEFDAAFWSEARQLALLRRDFDGWPFAVAYRPAQDGRMQPISPNGEKTQDIIKNSMPQLTSPPQKQLPGA